jgi:hypothetical protein
MLSPRRWRERRRNDAEFRVLDVLADGEWHYGYDLGKEARLRPARLYAAIGRLMEKRVVHDRWDALEPGHEYPRRMYRLDPAFRGFRG